MLGAPGQIRRRSGVGALAATGAALALVVLPGGGNAADTQITRLSSSSGSQVVTFLLSPDGSMVTEFHFTNTCTTDSLGTRVPQGIPVVNGTFAYTSPTIQVTGSVTGPSGPTSVIRAKGTARYVPDAGCDSHSKRWSASSAVGLLFVRTDGVTHYKIVPAGSTGERTGAAAPGHARLFRDRPAHS